MFKKQFDPGPFNCTTELKSATGGQSFYTMEYSHQEPVPPNIQQQLKTAFKPTEAE